MNNHTKLSEYLQTLDFLGARKSSDYIGTKEDNPAMILEENMSVWAKLTDIEDLQECFKVFEERVCVTNFPARYSPQFWLAHAALSTIYDVLCVYLETDCDEESRTETNNLLFELWCRLISSGPGSSHLEMMDIILKYQHYPLWKHLQALSGDEMTILVSTLKTDFVYVEDVSADHYATLMETHIDKIFKAILSDRQMEEARRGLLDLCLFYLSRMNHVPPHIGPRLSHLCFLICNRYKFENPYMGYDDWVLLRHHMKTIKDVIIDSTFTVASEAQYRAPLTLEKIFQAAIADRMLDIMFKDFMTLLLTICNHGNSKKCKRLFTAYQTGLFEPIDFKKGFDSTPNWMFDQCIQTLGKLSKTIAMETHIDEFIISAQHLILEKFSKLSSGQVASWHELMVNYLVSGRTLLIKEAGILLNSSILKNNNGLNWKTNCDQWKLFIDIISDIPGAFLQKDENDSPVSTVQEYANFVQILLEQIMEIQFEGRVRQNIHKCLLQCLEKESALKAAISYVCVQSTIPDLTDTNFIRDVLFTVDTLLRDPGCPINDKTVTDVIMMLLKACLELFRSKGYVAVDLNSLFMSICLSCLSVDSDDVTQSSDVTQSHDVTLSCDVTQSHDVTQSCDVLCDKKTGLWNSLYLDAVLKYLELHISKGTARSISPLVPQILLAMQDSLQKQATIPKRCIHFLSAMSSDCFQFVSDHVTKILEIFLEWQNDDFLDLILVLYKKDEQAILSIFQEIFNRTLQVEHEYRHFGMILLEELSKNHPEIFLASHICLLLGTYSTESEITKCHILNIVLNVSRHNPSVVVGYFSMLIDDSKFDEQSLPQRAPVLKCLCQQNEEISQRSVEYLMKYVGSTNEDISIVAMETLIPLFKERPSLIQKQKVKLKNLWKTSNNSQVKDLCVKILPEIRSAGKVPAVKSAQNRIKADNKSNINKGVKGTIAGSRITQQKTPRLLKETVMLPSKTSKEPDKGSLSGKKTPTDSSNTRVSVEVTVDVNSVKANETLDNTNGIEKAVKKQVEQNDDKVGKTEQNLTESVDINKEPKKHEPDIVLDKTLVVKDSTKAGGDTDNKDVEKQSAHDTSASGPKKENCIEVNELIGITAPTESDSKKDLQESVEIKVKIENESSQKSDPSLINSPSITSQFDEPKVHLYSSVESIAFINKLSEKLKMAGYCNIVKNSSVDNGNNSTSAKVVIFCCDRFDVNSDQSLAKQMSDLELNGVPVICLRSKPHISNGLQQMTLIQGHQCIRFYVKPDEETLLGTKWPKYKFCELLMQLNYCGIIRDDKLVTPEFRSLWETRTDEKEKHLRKSFDDRSLLLPDIFVSYQWGKQNQVEPLYLHLMSEGFLCWMGAYQMDGSESLYNKIQQGLQSCRVVLACVTKKYEHCQICQRDIKTASKLGRAVIPVLLDDCQWPLGGVIGDLLKGSDPIKLKSVYNVQRGFLPSGLKSLISRLRHYTVTNRDDHVLEIPSEIRSDAFDEEEEDEDDDDEIIDEFNENSGPSINAYTKSSCTNSTLMEFKKYSGDPDIIERRHSNATDVVRRDVASGDMWSEDGYPLRASRSKSCTLL